MEESTHSNEGHLQERTFDSQPQCVVCNGQIPENDIVEKCLRCNGRFCPDCSSDYHQCVERTFYSQPQCLVCNGQIPENDIVEKCLRCNGRFCPNCSSDHH
ncbi:uncharacterized protein LOC144432377 [Styela clava]